MATVTPQQKQQLGQISQTLNQLQQALIGIGKSISTASPQVVSQVAPSLSQALGTTQQALVGTGGALGSSPQITKTTTASTPRAPDYQTVTQDYQKKMENLLKAYEQALAAKPTIVGLTPEEKSLYQQAETQLKERYQKALEELQRKQQEEQQRLAARYAAAGFSEPGVLGGAMAGTPGIVTRALQELGEQQARERTALEQAQAGDILALQQAQAEAERRAREAEHERWAKEQSQKLENLLRQVGLYEAVYGAFQPETFKVGERIFEKDPITGQVREVTPPEVLEALKEEEIKRAWDVYFDKEGGEIIRYNPITGERMVIGRITPRMTADQENMMRTTGVRMFLEGKKKDNGFVNAESYLEALQKWLDMGGNKSEFEIYFPLGQWLEEEEILRLNQLLGKGKTKGSEISDEDLEGLPF